MVVAPGIPVPVLLGTDIYALSLSNPVMVTTRAQAKRNSSIMTDTEGTSEERTAESHSLETIKDISATDAPNGESTVNLPGWRRREEEPTSIPQGLNPLQANVDDMKLWILLWLRHVKRL